MNSPSKTSKDAKAASMPFLTAGKLPLSPETSGVALLTTDIGDGGPTRRIAPPSNIGAASLPSELSAVPLKGHAHEESSVAFNVPKPSLVVAPRISRSVLRECPYRSSLVDADDEELFNLFGESAKLPAASRKDPVVGDATNRGWDVRDEIVPTLPSFYPVDKSAVFVPHVSANVVADRVQDVLRFRSISAVYRPDHAKVECMSNGVEFQIRLYRGRGDFDHGIIVEVQRMDGFNVRYQKDVFAILDAAEGTYHESQFNDMALNSEAIPVGDTEVASSASLHLLTSILCPKDEKKATIGDIDFVLTSLSALTDSARMGKAAEQISKELLLSDECAELRQAVLSKICSPSTGIPLVAKSHALKSLEILANIGLLNQDAPEFKSLIVENGAEIFNEFISNIEDVTKHPRAADLSCVIMKVLCDDARALDIISLQSRERLVAALIAAVSHGNDFHSDLKLHSQQCLGVISL